MTSAVITAMVCATVLGVVWMALQLVRERAREVAATLAVAAGAGRLAALEETVERIRHDVDTQTRRVDSINAARNLR